MRTIPMPESVTRLLRENYTAVSKELIAPLLDLLTVSREVCGGDLEKVLILLVVAQRTAQHQAVAELSLEDLLSSREEAFPSLRTNVRSIAESTGVPRETVRRKVGELVAAGWVARRGDDLSYTPDASRALTPVRDAILELATRFHAVVATQLEQAAHNGSPAARKAARKR